MKKLLFLFTIGAGLAPLALLADENLPEVHIPLVTKPVKIDGDIQEAAWSSAVHLKLSEFWTKGEPLGTDVLLMYDRKNLYVAFQCVDHDVISTHSEHDDQTYRDDCVEVLLTAPTERISDSVGIEINPQGTVADYYYRYADWFNYSWESRVHVATHLSKDGYVIKMAIPWNTLLPAVGAAGLQTGLRGNFGRWDRPSQRYFLWSYSGFPIPYPHQPNRFGKLIFDDLPAEP